MPDAIFRGWLRLPRSKWQPVVTATSEADAWRLLQEHVDHLGARVADLYIGQPGADPRRRAPSSQEANGPPGQ